MPGQRVEFSLGAASRRFRRAPGGDTEEVVRMRPDARCSLFAVISEL